MAYTARGRRERRVRRILHNAWCRPDDWTCRGDNSHAFTAYRDLGATIAAAPDRAAVLAILHDRVCPHRFDRTRTCDEVMHSSAGTPDHVVIALLRALRV